MLDWAHIDTVLLDMDGTLLDLHFDNFFWLEHVPRRHAERQGWSLERAKADLFPRMKAVEGTIDWYCLDYWSRELDLPIARLKREVQDLIMFRPQADLFLRRLQRASKRRVLVTNAHRDALALKLERTELANHVDVLISSHDYGLPKEDQRFWDALRAQVPFDPARTVLLDDSPRVLASARRYGIAHLLGVVEPDSRAPAKEWVEFAAVESFAALAEGL
ncbi:GMP/IMP nucleotidase [Alkalilimnicola sp. S0819]|uniref:GMP/IMP nucleotidase n=1 Tax=Alkalilimnicola sp. S0819 TaxID=2613922 RepID=UPI00126292BE|nr:GMP/IMP nucleotidase [Alkalilimnicola sp. S0819]KAB7622985.1 GMP/IMP nucleotidase [Alkalilimnicola sp. S0819]MPQ17095.1 GMP/IMP nucleotidase [Alkalilimnicola sp. S0819]